MDEQVVKEISDKIGKRIKKKYPLRDKPADTEMIVRETLILIGERILNAPKRPS
jgi:hypothetical protein